ncbi:MAG: helix-turn-helix transcriptional regulator [Oscillospiraceae bacterium]|nr:helix-turn-helix transcriptional regulator [Oscillospiraceae bacterium]
MTMGEKILNMRKARGWSQEELADRVGVSRQAVSRWESGSAKPEADKIIVLCDLFGVSADYLLRDNYAGERVPVMADQQEPVRQVTVKRRFLQIYAVCSVLALFALKFMSSVSPKAYISRKMLESGEIITQGDVVTGLLGFTLWYNLEWFLILALIGIAVGFVLIWQGSPILRKKTKSLFGHIRRK